MLKILFQHTINCLKLLTKNHTTPLSLSEHYFNPFFYSFMILLKKNFTLLHNSSSLSHSWTSLSLNSFEVHFEKFIFCLLGIPEYVYGNYKLGFSYYMEILFNS